MNIANRIILSVINLFLITLVSACASHEDSAVDELLSRCSELDKAYTTSNADSVLREVASIEDGPLAKVRLDVKTFCLILRARGAEFKGEQDSAIVKFDDVLKVEIPADTMSVRWSSIKDNAHWSLIQLLNCYQMKGEPQACVDRLRALADNPTPIVARYLMPDAYAVLGYALSRNYQPKDAAEAIDKAMALGADSLPANRRFMIYTYAAAACFELPERQNDVMRWCESCLDIAMAEKDVMGLHWLTSMLGSLYQRTGEVSKAIDMYRKSYKVAEDCKDSPSIVWTCVMLTDLYLTYNMPQFADIYNREALYESEQMGKMSDPKMRGYALMMKGRIMRQENKPDSAIVYWNIADSVLRSLPYDSGMADLETAIGEMSVEDSSIVIPRETGMRRLENVVTKSLVAETRAKAYFLLAEGYRSAGDFKRCEVSLDSMRNLLSLTERPIYVEKAYKFALDYYLSTGNKEKIELYARKLNKELSLFYNSKTYDSIIGQMLRFHSEKNEAQILAAEMEVQKKNLQIKYYVALSVLLLILLGFCVAWILVKRRIYRIKSIMARQQIDSLIDNLHEVNHNCELMEERIKELNSDEDMLKRFTTLTPKTLREDGESRFRYRFTCMYPQFINSLREMAPGVTRREEILCMLIALGQTTDDIVDLMCIARTSVNIMRHRIRRKLNLDKAESLEDVLQALVSVK